MGSNLFKSMVIGCSLLFMPTACNNPALNHVGSGAVKFKVQLPKQDNQFNIKVIPSTTKAFSIKISGIGMENTRQDNLTFDANGVALYKADKLPLGNKSISVTALDDNGAELARGSAQVEILAGQTSTAEIELEKLPEVEKTPEPESTPTAIPSPSPEPTPTATPSPEPSPTQIPTPTLVLVDPDQVGEIDTSQQSTHQSNIDGSFEQSTLSLSVGESIRWTNSGNGSVELISGQDLFANQSIAAGASFSFTFNTAGSFRFKLGGGSTMTVEVN